MHVPKPIEVPSILFGYIINKCIRHRSYKVNFAIILLLLRFDFHLTYISFQIYSSFFFFFFFFYFILSSEFNAFLKQTKMISSAEKTFFTSDEDDLYFFTANRGCFLGLNFFQKTSGMHRSCLKLRYRYMHVQLSK